LEFPAVCPELIYNEISNLQGSKAAAGPEELKENQHETL